MSVSCQLPCVLVVVVAIARSRPTVDAGVDVPKKVTVLVAAICTFCCGERMEIYEIVLVASLTEKMVAVDDSTTTVDGSVVTAKTVDPPPKPGLMAKSGGMVVVGAGIL